MMYYHVQYELKDHSKKSTALNAQTKEEAFQKALEYYNHTADMVAWWGCLDDKEFMHLIRGDYDKVTLEGIEMPEKLEYDVVYQSEAFGVVDRYGGTG
jgi:hypothetical protein